LKGKTKATLSFGVVVAHGRWESNLGKRGEKRKEKEKAVLASFYILLSAHQENLPIWSSSNS